LMMDSHLPDLADPYEDSEADEFDLSENGAYEDRDDDERMDDINQFQDETDDE